MKSKQPLDLKLTISKKQFILKIVVDCHMRYVILTLILMLTAGIAGYTIGTVKATKGSFPQLTQKMDNETKTSNPLFQTESATITGSVTSINNKDLTIANQKNQTGQFMASDRMLIFKFAATGPTSSPSADIKSVELNKQAVFILEKKRENYEIVSIRYLPNLK